MATMESWAQDVITCVLCDKPCRKFCNDCQVNLCVDCLGKHVGELQFQSHDIVHLKNRNLHVVFPDCKTHLGQRCEVYCKECHEPICIKCSIGRHKTHDVCELDELVEIRKIEIEKEVKELESEIIPKFQGKNATISDKKDHVAAEYAILEQKLEELRKTWQLEVNKLFNALGSLITSKKNMSINDLTNHQTNIAKLTSDMIETVQHNKQMIQTKNASKVTDYKSKFDEFKNVPKDVAVEIPFLKTNIVTEKELCIEIGEIRAILTKTSLSHILDDYTYLQTTELPDEAKMLTIIPTENDSLIRVACTVLDEAWICGEKQTITRIGLEGDVKETVTTKCLYWPDDIAVTSGGELVYNDPDRETVNIVRSGRTETLITAPLGWKPHRLCCTKSRGILVSMSNGRHNKIIRYEENQISQVIEKNEDGKSIFLEGICKLYVTENENGDVCVSDTNASLVIVLDITGRVRFRYDGSAAKIKGPFNPSSLVTHSSGQTIITDNSNLCLHILDRNGTFLRCLDCFGQHRCYGLSVDMEGRLWLAFNYTNEIKVLNFLK